VIIIRNSFLNQSRSTFIRTPNSYFQLFVNFCYIYLWVFDSRLFPCTSVPEVTTPQLISAGAGWGKGNIRSLFSASVAGARDEPLRTSAWEATGDVALCFFKGLFFVKAGRYVIKDGLISLQRIFQ